MKKSIIYSLAVSSLVVSTIFTVAVSQAITVAPPDDTHSEVYISDLAPAPTFTSKDESVYIITDSTGTPTKSFIGSTINTSTAKFPVDMKIKYELDNTEITADELIGKSGHVKLTYSFTATSAYQDKLIPFLTITGLDFDTHKFSNIKIDNGKLIKESTDSIILAGYTMPGLNQDLGTDFLPDSFTVEADVKDFAMKDTYTFATNEFFSDIDVDKLNSVNDLINSVNKLSDALDQLIDGSTKLSDGLDSALSGAKQLQTGIKQVNTGAHELAGGAGQVNAGAHELANGASQLSSGLDQVVDVNNQIMSKVTPITNNIDTVIAELKTEIATISETDPELAAELTKLLTKLTSYYTEANTAVNQYVNGIQSLADGAKALSAGANQLTTGTDALATGANQLAAGTDQLSTGTNTLVDGLSQLGSGSHTLTNGLSTFKAQGIDRLVNFANHDLDNFLRNLRATVSAAKSYTHYTTPTSTSVKFIFKTPSVE